ncbi:malto-oligosyltrehalose trehalohydrolase [Caulobacter endophyticus]|uniref:Malto-oligosyltrehalose trehalohydrolase n=1 Tax=Caulobacter endophyticus TaxID=2172652 RepID=A0A2T9JGX5_9CAUL|nr:malto-oligosyltrehalose trehalohydrolase [Caulobacter endophyticus]PVM82942.1 malto-oligosyltrehalose trehalohydrolase [Caulobacter endophyticus]
MTQGHGPYWLNDAQVRFRLWAPGRKRVAVELDGTGAFAMTPAGEGWFEHDADAAPGVKYRFRIDDDLVVPDPAARAQAEDVHGWSLLVGPDAYAWRNPGWFGRAWSDAVICEVHAGALGGFVGVSERLQDLSALGVTVVQLMPINAFSGSRNWGYDGVLPYAPAGAYGSPDDLKALVDTAHGLGMMVLLDVVYNHFGPDGNYLPAYAKDFFDEARQTPWGPAIAFGREPVARFFIDNAIHWLETFRFDGLRFDAVHAIGDNDFLDRLAAEVRARFPDRHIHLVLENEANDAERLTRGFDAQWNDDFHNVLHVLLTDETSSYYQDFADRPAERLARCLAEGFIYQGEGSPNHDGKPRGGASAHLPPTAFVNFLQNHDQIGNRALGERLTTLVSQDRLRAAMGLLLMSPQIPMLFMGEDSGSETPFLFFTDFHDDLADAVREGRRREFAKFPAFADPQSREAIPDPNAPSTFEASRPLAGPDAERWRELISHLLRLRRDNLAPHLDSAISLGASAIGPKAVQAAWRLGDKTYILAVNLGDAAAPLSPAPPGPPLVVVGDAPSDGQLPPAAFAAWLAQEP